MRPVRWNPIAGTRRRALTRTLAAAMAAGLPALAVAQGTCPLPPQVPDSLLRNNVPWHQMQSFLDAQASWAADSQDSLIIPCRQTSPTKPPCVAMQARISAVTQARCASLGALQTGTYLMGKVERYSGSNYPQLGFGAQNPSGVVYMVVWRGLGVVFFQDPANTVQVIAYHPTAAGPVGWRFQFGPEPDSVFAVSRARWIPASQNPHGMAQLQFRRTAAVRSGPADLLPDDAGDVQEDSSVGWMSCAAGCCQFHGTPPGSGPGQGQDDDQGQDNQGHRPHRPRMQVQKDRAPSGR